MTSLTTHCSVQVTFNCTVLVTLGSQHGLWSCSWTERKSAYRVNCGLSTACKVSTGISSKPVGMKCCSITSSGEAISAAVEPAAHTRQSMAMDMCRGSGQHFLTLQVLDQLTPEFITVGDVSVGQEASSWEAWWSRRARRARWALHARDGRVSNTLRDKEKRMILTVREQGHCMV